MVDLYSTGRTFTRSPARTLVVSIVWDPLGSSGVLSVDASHATVWRLDNGGGTASEKSSSEVTSRGRHALTAAAWSLNKPKVSPGAGGGGGWVALLSAVQKGGGAAGWPALVLFCSHRRLTTPSTTRHRRSIWLADCGTGSGAQRGVLGSACQEPGIHD